MLRIENVEVMGWEHAIRGMRNPMNSWEKSDSRFDTFCDNTDCESCPTRGDDHCVSKLNARGGILAGPNDIDLMTRLSKAGSDHRKFMRMITVYLDVTAPLYWWKEYDTYKIGTVANSCSTMHKIHAKEFTLDDFSCEHLINKPIYQERETGETVQCNPLVRLKCAISDLNVCRTAYLETKDKEYWWQMIQLLPTSYNQKRTLMLNYEVLANIYHSRKNHKLDEWLTFCDWIETLPYHELITDIYKKG